MEWLHLLLDSELSSADHEKLLAHLQTCKRCSAAYRELSLLEAAHAELDARATEAPKDYFDALPQRVLARIEAAERPAMTQPRILTLRPRSFDLREFIFGRGKYALAFAAMLTLLFIVTRHLREQTTPERDAKENVPPASPTISQTEIPTREAQPESQALATSGGAQSPTAEGKSTAPSNIAVEEVAKNIEGVSSVASEPAFAKSEAARAAEPSADSEQVVLYSAAGLRQALDDTIATRQNLLAAQPQLVNNPPGEQPRMPTENREVSRFDAAHAPAALSTARQSQSLSAARVPSEEAARSSRAERIVAVDTRLAQALSASGQAQTQVERLKIWQDFFAHSKRDSASYSAAVEALARRLVAQSDSSSSVAQVQEALSFYQTMEAVLAARWGRATYDQERARLEGLLNWKKSVQP